MLQFSCAETPAAYFAVRGRVGWGGLSFFNSKSSPIKSNQLSEMDPYGASLMEVREGKDLICTAAQQEYFSAIINKTRYSCHQGKIINSSALSAYLFFSSWLSHSKRIHALKFPQIISQFHQRCFSCRCHLQQLRFLSPARRVSSFWSLASCDLKRSVLRPSARRIKGTNGAGLSSSFCVWLYSVVNGSSLFAHPSDTKQQQLSLRAIFLAT